MDRTRTTLLILIVFGGIAQVAHGLPMPTPVYQQDFEDESDPLTEWSVRTTERTPTTTMGCTSAQWCDTRFLGRFGGSTILTLTDLPQHDYIQIHYDLYIIGSWDREHGDLDAVTMVPVGPDVYETRVLNTAHRRAYSFSNMDELGYVQTFPDDRRHGRTYAAYTGSSERDTLGYAPLNFGNAVYEPGLSFTHTGDTVQIQFMATGLSDVLEESWGIDNINVVTIDTAQPVPEAGSMVFVAVGLGLMGAIMVTGRRRA